MKKLLFSLLFILFLVPSGAKAHGTDQSYIFLRVYEKDGIEGRFELTLKDLNDFFGWGIGKDELSLESIRPHMGQIKEYLTKNSAFSSVDQNYQVVFSDEVTILPSNYGNFLQIPFTLVGAEEIPENLKVTYSALLDPSSNHKNFLVVEYNWKAGIISNEANIALDFSASNPTSTLSLTEGSRWSGFAAMIRQGIWHIWIGIDHILFLLALILPSVVRRIKRPDDSSSVGQWTPVERFKPAFIYVIKIITFFTIAHTITLSLASLRIVNLPSQLVESIIALSIGLAAFHNIRPIFKGRDWIIAFVFGLFHGFGFASVLGDLGLIKENLSLSLLGFNIGVEIGQLIIIAMIFPVLFIIRKTKVYNKLLFYGSIVLILISLYWGLERIFDVSFGLERTIKLFFRDVLVWLGLW